MIFLGSYRQFFFVTQLFPGVWYNFFDQCSCMKLLSGRGSFLICQTNKTTKSTIINSVLTDTKGLLINQLDFACNCLSIIFHHFFLCLSWQSIILLGTVGSVYFLQSFPTWFSLYFDPLTFVNSIPTVQSTSV